MKSRAILKFVLALAGLVFSPSIGAQADPPKSEPVRFHDLFARVLSETMPFDGGKDLRVGVRSYQDLYTSEFEYSFVIRAAPKSGLYAIVRVPDGASIFDQLSMLHSQQPSLQFEEIRKALRIKEWSLAAAQCPAIQTSLDALNRISFQLPKDDLIILHPRIYVIKVRRMTSDWDISLYDDQHPLVRWAEDTQTALNACIRKVEAAK